MVKTVKSVSASKKKLYMLFDIEPDISVTGGTWYSNQDFEVEFVDVLNQQCFRFLDERVGSFGFQQRPSFRNCLHSSRPQIIWAHF